MLRSMNEIVDYHFFAKKENIGRCKDLLFDDWWWTVRHLVADTGGWLEGHQVLISPVMIEKMDWKTRMVMVNITKDQLENCPSPSDEETVSREHEKQIFMHYGYPDYWNGTGLWGAAAYPWILDTEPVMENQEKDDGEETRENHLRSFKELKGYSIKASDGEIGHVEDFILDDETWALRYVIVDTRNWLPGGKKVMLSLNWARSVSWSESSFEMDMPKEKIEKGPEFDPEKPVNVEYETRLYDYYGRPFEKNIDKNLQKHIANPFI